MKQRVIGYVRVSTERQASQGHSAETIQPDQIRRYCRAFGLELVDIVHDDGVSAGKFALEQRPGGKLALQMLRGGEVDGVVIQRIDRMFRISIDGLMTAAQFGRDGITIHSVSERIDTSSPEGWLQLSILLATAEYERNKCAQRAKETSAGLLRAGRVYGGAPYGTQEVDGKLFRDAATWPLRERICAAYATAGMSYRKLVKWCRAEAIPSPTGCRRWSVSTLRRVVITHDDLQHIPWPDGRGAGSPAVLRTAVQQPAGRDGTRPSGQGICPTARGLFPTMVVAAGGAA